MLITPLQLHKEPLKLDEILPEGAVDYTADVRQAGPLTVKGRAELLEEHRGHGETVEDIRLRAKISGKFEQLCARCLEPVPEIVNTDVDLIYRPAGVDQEGGEHAISEEETEIGYYEKSGLLLEDAVREQVLLTLPGRVLCREECQGPVLADGRRPGIADSDADESAPDPRWNALAGIAVKSRN